MLPSRMPSSLRASPGGPLSCRLPPHDSKSASVKPYSGSSWSSSTLVECVASSRTETRSAGFRSAISASDVSPSRGCTAATNRS